MNLKKSRVDSSNVLSIYVLLHVPMVQTQLARQKQNVLRVKMVLLAGLKISESVKVPMKKMMAKVHQMEKNQTVKNQTVRNQKTKKIMTMTKKNQTVRNQTVKNLKTTRKAKNQKVQHQLAKMVNGKNVKN